MHNRKNLLAALIALLVAGLLLGACATPAAEVEVAEEPEVVVTEEVVATEEPVEEAEAPTEAPAATEEPVVEETEEPTEEMADTAALDANVAAFLEGMEGYNFVQPEAVNEALVEGEVFLLDVREPGELEENGYIEGAVNIPVREVGHNIDKLPALDAPVIVYCASGTRATLAMVALGELGYTDVKAMVGGSFGGWVEAGYPAVEGTPPEAEVLDAASPDPAAVAAVDAMLSGLPEGFAQLDVEALNEEMVDGAELVLLDVRRAEEVEEAGAIAGAINIPVEELAARMDEWPAMDADLVIYCKAGSRGNIAMAILRAYGYENVRNLKGGFESWADAGYPVEGGSGMSEAGGAADLDSSVAAFLANMEGYNFVQPEAVNEMLVEGEVFLLDVREPAELEENGYIEGAVNIPLREIGQNVDKLPALDSPVIVYCAAGTRAALGMVALGELGYTDVKAMLGGSFGGWVEGGYPVAEGAPPAAEVLDAAAPDAALVAAVDAMLSGLPDGYAQLDAAALNEELIDGAELVLVDVRRAEEVEETGLIEGATNIPLEELVARSDEWPALDADVVIYCKAGSRGNIAMAILRTYGYETIRNLKGGFDGWLDAGFPVSAE